MLKLYKSQGVTVFALFFFSFLLLFSAKNFAQGFQSVTNLNSLTVSAITGEKPQSKVWTYAGKWWMVMPNSSGTQIWRLDGIAWTSVLNIDASTATYADCKAVGNVTHIFLYKGTSSSLVSVEYVPTSTTYQLWTTRTSTVSITLDAGVETATIDIDGTGRMWLASPGTTSMYVRWSDSPYSSWSSPITIATGVNDDDICAVTAFDGKIGVLWSNQNTQRFGFKYHVDGADPSTWSVDEVPASQSAQNVGLGMADDHLNMAVAGDGTLYCAVKTSYDTPTYAKIALLVRRPAGTWDDLYYVDDAGTRGIVLLNESNKKVFVAYTSAEGNNPIVYKSTSTTTISFGTRTTLISSSCNDITSTKQNIVDYAVLLASNGTTAYSVLACDNSLVGHWAMEDNSGAATLIDSSPFGNSATVTGSLIQVAGQRGYGQNFTGSSNYALVPNSTSLNITNNITLATWIKPEANTTQDVLNKKENGTTNGYELTLSASTAQVVQKVFVRFNQVTSGDAYRVNSTTTYPTDGTWIHAAATYDGTTIKLYINGMLESTMPAAITIASNTLPLGLGAQSDGLREFSGSIDDARIYNVALTQSEIQTLLSTWAPPPAVPNAPILLSPTNLATDISLNPTLTWNASTSATSYRVQVSTISNFSTTVYDQSGITSTNTSVSGLSNGTLYYWRVNATNAQGTSEWSTVWSFTTIIPAIQDNGAGYALDFDGANNVSTTDYVNCGNGTSLNITTSSLTIEAWIKPTTQKTHSIVKRFQTSGTVGYELFLANNASPNRYVSFRLNNSNRVNSSTNYPIDGTWMHVAATYDYSTKEMKMYVNGVQEGGAVTGPTSIESTTNPLTIGSELSDFSKAFQGCIDEVRVWNVVRSDVDIKANMTKKLVGNESGLVGYWRFDETSGTAMNDETSNNNDGTMINMETADHVWSGAALGDASAYDYVATGGYTATLSHANGDAITATTTSGTITGIQVYRADDNAVRTGSTVPTGYTLDPSRFWGVRAIGTSTPTYTLVYNYSGNPIITNEIGLKLVKRNDISVATWTDAGAVLDINANTLTVTGATGTEYALALPTLIPPSAPTLVSPTNGSTITEFPILTTTVSDNNSTNLTVKFYGRMVEASDLFRIIKLPDTQNYSASYPAIFTSQTQWIVNNKTSQNIVYVSHVGDIVNTANTQQEWINASGAMYLLDGQVPYGTAVGNHDITSGTYFENYFGVSHFNGYDYYGDSYAINNNQSHYDLITVGDLEFIIIYLEVNPSPAVLTWANNLLSTSYPQRRGIVVNHDILDAGGSLSTNGTSILNALKGSQNLFMMFCGHYAGEAYKLETGTNSNPIHIILADYQSRSNGGDGWLRILEFNKPLNQINVKTFTPYLSPRYETDANSQFTLTYDMGGGTDGPFVELTSVTVPNNTNATYYWGTLLGGKTYEWYVTIEDENNNITTGPTWSFITDPALPVELSSFTAKVKDNNVILNWRTETEVSNYGFEVERSNNQSNWTKIGFVEGHGNSNSPKNYIFTDKNPVGGSNFYYRLKQIDTDGKSAYSDPVEVSFIPDEYLLYQNYPNPFNPTTTIQFSLIADNWVNISVYSVLGEKVETLTDGQLEKGIHEVKLNASNLASGVYIYKLSVGKNGEDYTGIKKMMILK
jgi:hypothetical protein